MGSIEFLADVLASGLDLEQISADDVMRHVPIETLAATLPTDLKAALLAAALKAAKMDNRFVLETLGVDALCRAAATPQVWACIAEAAVRAIERGGATPAGGKGEGKGKAATGVAVPLAAPAISPATSASAGEGAPTTPASASTAAGAAPADASGRRPQAAATASASPTVKARSTPGSSRRGATDFDLDIDTDVGAEWPSDRSQTVRPEEVDEDAIEESMTDWAKGEETAVRDGSPRK